MRIYRRAEFLKLPEGTLFCRGKPWCWEELSVKGESMPNDFGELGLQWIEAESSSDASETLDRMLEEGISAPLQTSGGRDGRFDEADLFLVYELADLRQMAFHIDAAIGVAKTVEYLATDTLAGLGDKVDDPPSP